MNDTCGIIILGHGTRRKEAGETFFALVDKVALRISHAQVVPACFSCGSPSLPEQARYLAGAGCTTIIIFPYFLLSGKHIADELPCFVESLKKEFPRIRFELRATMEDEPLLEELVVTRLLQHLAQDGCRVPHCEALEERQQNIVDALAVRSDIPAGHFPLIQAIAHATGDLSLALGLRIHDRAMEEGRSVLRTGGVILCDSPMLPAGLPSLLTKMIPGLKEAGSDVPQTENLLLSEECTCFLEAQMAGAVIAVGREPAILLHVMDLVARGVSGPALVVGLPAGFVEAAHAKEVLVRSGLVHISNAGSRGGILCVAAVLNALAVSPEV